MLRIFSQGQGKEGKVMQCNADKAYRFGNSEICPYARQGRQAAEKETHLPTQGRLVGVYHVGDGNGHSYPNSRLDRRCKRNRLLPKMHRRGLT